MRSEFVQLTCVIAGEALQRASALTGEREQNLAAIAGIDRALEQAGVLAAMAELDNAVVTQAKPLRDVRDGDELAGWGAGDLEEKLMLLGLKAGADGSGFAELQETAQLTANVGESAQQIGRYGFRGRHSTYRNKICALQANRDRDVEELTG